MCLFPNYVQRTTTYIFDEPIVTVKFVGSRKFDDDISFVDGVSTVIECIPVPCGKCIECLSQYSEIWSYRIMRECSFHKQNCMITLTYANNPVSLVKRDFQLFMKSLRKFLEPLRVRFFGSGEYGKKGSRPHYHVIIFGWLPDDLRYFFSRNGHSVYLSDKVSKIWKRGFITVEEVTLDTAKYCAKYLQKLQALPKGLLPPFTLMSNRPGIGYSDTDFSYLTTDKLYYHGRYISTPRYLLKKAEDKGYDLTDLKDNRLLKSRDFSNQSQRKLATRQRYISKFGEKFLKSP